MVNQPKYDYDADLEKGSFDENGNWTGPAWTNPKLKRFQRDSLKPQERTYLDDQGLLPNGSWMCLDGKARNGDWEAAKAADPDSLNWLTEWVVAARTGQLKKAQAEKDA